MSELSDKVVLVTGGAGSLGRHLTEMLSREARTVRVFDSDEYGLYKLQHALEKKENVRFLLGDVRDRERVKLAVAGVDYVVHMAATKNIEITEYNAPEAIRVNLDGTINLVELAISEGVSKFIFTSSDKAVDHTTLYGATKFAGEKVVLWANRISGKKYSVFRPCNLFQARGNVFERWEEEANTQGWISLTHPEMKRYYIFTEQAARLVLDALGRMQGGEVFVPKGKEYLIKDLARHRFPRTPLNIIGLRREEKLSEVLLTKDELRRSQDVGEMWCIRER